MIRYVAITEGNRGGGPKIGGRCVEIPVLVADNGSAELERALIEAERVFRDRLGAALVFTFGSFVGQ